MFLGAKNKFINPSFLFSSIIKKYKKQLTTADQLLLFF